MEDFDVYKVMHKLLNSFSNLFPKKEVNNKGTKLVSVCGRCKYQLPKCSRRKGLRLVKKTKKNPMHCAICKRKLAPPYIRGSEHIKLKEEQHDS